MATLWFCLAAATITGYVLLDGFDLGAGIVQLFVTRTENEKSRVLRSISPVWDGNEVWLLGAGGTLFFAFPALYASAFSGFYLSLMIVLWLLILRGISIEFRSDVDSPLWQAAWSTIFSLSSAVGRCDIVLGAGSARQSLGGVKNRRESTRTNRYVQHQMLDSLGRDHAAHVRWQLLDSAKLDKAVPQPPLGRHIPGSGRRGHNRDTRNKLSAAGSPSVSGVGFVLDRIAE
jgi:Cytochrome bd terminal oxidase subunit II